MLYTLIVHICSNTNSTWTGKNIYVDDLKSLHRLTYIYVLYILYVVYIIYSVYICMYIYICIYLYIYIHTHFYYTFALYMSGCTWIKQWLASSAVNAIDSRNKLMYGWTDCSKNWIDCKYLKNKGQHFQKNVTKNVYKNRKTLLR